MKKTNLENVKSSDQDSNPDEDESCIHKCLTFNFVEDCLPACCHTPKWEKCRKISKYIYVIGVIVIGFLLAFLQQVSDPIDEWLDSQQTIILTFLIDDHWIYIILVLLFITFLKSIGVKDVLGLRTISVVILSYRICRSPPGATLFIAMFIIGILSSVSKLIEYQVIGHELQVVQGTPVEFIFKYIRMLLMCCMRGKTQEEKEEKLEWLDPKWTFEISEVSRGDKSMNVMHNIACVLQDVTSKCACCQKCLDVDRDCDDLEMHQKNSMEKSQSSKPNMNNMNGKNSSRAENLDKEPSHNHDGEGKLNRYLWKTLYFVIAVVWTSASEWIQPITELFLFAHNWDFSLINATIIVLSEFADIDKAVEAWFLITELNEGDEYDIITAKAKALLSKTGFWALGYCVILPPTLFWAYRYHYIHKDRIHKEREKLGLTNNNDEFSSNNQIIQVHKYYLILQMIQQPIQRLMI